MTRIARAWAIWLLVGVNVAGGCARPRQTVMALRDIPADQQQRDRDECAREVGILNVGKPVAGVVGGQLAGALIGAGAGALVSLGFIPTTNEAREVAFTIGLGAAAGAAIGFIAGTIVGYQAGMEAARDDAMAGYVECMRQRGYSVIRERG